MGGDHASPSRSFSARYGNDSPVMILSDTICLQSAHQWQSKSARGLGRAQASVSQAVGIARLQKLCPAHHP